MADTKKTPAEAAKSTADDLAPEMTEAEKAAAKAAEVEMIKAGAAKRIGKVTVVKTDKDGTPLRQDGRFVTEQVSCRPEHVIGFSVERGTAVTVDGVKHQLNA